MLLVENQLFQLIESGMIKNHYVDVLYPVHRCFFFRRILRLTPQPQALAAKKSPVIFIFIRALDDQWGVL